MHQSQRIDAVLDILGNSSRRRILRLLAEEPRYFLQLSKELDVSQQAVLRHLELLERHGLISSFERKSDLAGPPRKYYELIQSLYLIAVISRDSVQLKIQDVPSEARELPEKSPRELRELERRLRGVRRVSNHVEALKEVDGLLMKINAYVRRLEKMEIFLLGLRQDALKLGHKIMRESFKTLLERRVLHSSLGSDKPIGIESLSREFNIREKEVEKAVKTLQKKLLFLRVNDSVQTMSTKARIR